MLALQRARFEESMVDENNQKRDHEQRQGRQHFIERVFHPHMSGKCARHQRRDTPATDDGQER